MVRWVVGCASKHIRYLYLVAVRATACATAGATAGPTEGATVGAKFVHRVAVSYDVPARPLCG